MRDPFTPSECGASICQRKRAGGRLKSVLSPVCQKRCSLAGSLSVCWPLSQALAEPGRGLVGFRDGPRKGVWKREERSRKKKKKAAFLARFMETGHSSLTYIPLLSSAVSLPPLSISPTSYPPLMSHEDTDTRYLQPYPSATPTPGAQSAGSNANSRGDDNGPFDPANTPPLVFAFIAVGFIVFGLVIATIYKRCRPLPNSPHQRSSIPIRRPSAQKPQLWDVWTTPNHRVSDNERINLNDWDTFVVSRPFSSVHTRKTAVDR